MGSLYSEHRTWLHAVPAGYKLLLFALLGTLQYASDSLTVLGLGTAACLLLFASLGRAVRVALR
ncbi:MAG: energy-coupling factor transporter transmembrane protein EcfT, partial [Rhodoferax sp.]|nr:energy-coupling factor transporter transmembrane protein EcfT [Rhodoferax sp.]